jgi:hypothetical protein
MTGLDRVRPAGWRLRLTIADDVIVAIHIVRNPDKLQFLARPLAGGQVQ